MNVYDSDKMKDIFISHNMQPTDDYLNADFVVLNTCHIREKATEKTFSHLGSDLSPFLSEGSSKTLWWLPQSTYYVLLGSHWAFTL